MAKSWSHSSTNWFSPFGDCLLSCCCPCILYGRTQQRLNGRPDGGSLCNLPCWGFACISSGGGCFGLSFILTAIQREEIRRKYQLEGSTGSSVCRAMFWEPCELVQHEKEVKIKGSDDIVLHQPTAAPAMRYGTSSSDVDPPHPIPALPSAPTITRRKKSGAVEKVVRLPTAASTRAPTRAPTAKVHDQQPAEAPVVLQATPEQLRAMYGVASKIAEARRVVETYADVVRSTSMSPGQPSEAPIVTRADSNLAKNAEKLEERRSDSPVVSRADSNLVKMETESKEHPAQSPIADEVGPTNEPKHAAESLTESTESQSSRASVVNGTTR